MRRRPYVVIAALSIASCAGVGDGPERGRPDECPVNRLSDRNPPPEDLDRQSAETYVKGYEAAYIEATEIDHRRYDQVEGPGANIIDVDTVDEGNSVHVETSWTGRWQEDDELVFEGTETSEQESVSADHEAIAEDAVLQDHLERAAEGERSSVLRESHRSYDDTYRGIREAAGDVDGAVIDYDDRFVRVTVREEPELIADGYDRSRYYVGPGVLYRSDHDQDPRDGVLLEC